MQPLPILLNHSDLAVVRQGLELLRAFPVPHPLTEHCQISADGIVRVSGALAGARWPEWVALHLLRTSGALDTVEVLDLSADEQMPDLAPILGLPALRVLRLLGHEALAIRSIPSWPALERLELFELELAQEDLSGCAMGCLVAEAAYFDGVDLRGADLAGARLPRLGLMGACLQGADLSGADLSGAYLWQVDLTDGVLRGARLGRARLDEVVLEGAILEEAILDGAAVSRTRWPGGAVLPDSVSVLDGGGDLAGRDFAGMRLDATDLAFADLRGCDFRGARLDDARLYMADLRGADLRDAHLISADLQFADLRGADLRGALSHDADLRGALYDDETRWPERFSAGHLRRLAPGAQLYGVLLDGRDLCGVVLRESGLDAAQLSGADLRGADLRGASLCSANVRGADLRGALLAGAVWTDALHDDETRWPGAPPLGVIRIAPGADLRGCRFGEMHFIGDADLSGADLRGADLSAVLMASGMVLTKARYDRETRWPRGVDPVQKGAVFSP